MNAIAKGSCLCGAVSFRIDGAFEGFFLCHCQRCRKDTGSAHAANLFSTGATLTWLSGTDDVVVYDLPETRHGKSFCRKCGSALARFLMYGTRRSWLTTPRHAGTGPAERAYLRGRQGGLGSEPAGCRQIRPSAGLT